MTTSLALANGRSNFPASMTEHWFDSADGKIRYMAYGGSAAEPELLLHGVNLTADLLC